jgi:microcompartment protein CcmL/EutN
MGAADGAGGQAKAATAGEVVSVRILPSPHLGLEELLPEPVE